MANMRGVFALWIDVFVILIFSTAIRMTPLRKLRRSWARVRRTRKASWLQSNAKKIGETPHGLNVPRDLVHAMIFDIDPDGLEMEARAPGTKKAKPKGHFISKGTNWVHSLDGHDKLMDHQNSTFPLAIYGWVDTGSRKLLWLRVWVSNYDPLIVGRWYLEFLYETRPIMARHLRMDKGTETGVLATMHAFLRRHHGDMDPVDTVLYGPSTSNKVGIIFIC